MRPEACYAVLSGTARNDYTVRMDDLTANQVALIGTAALFVGGFLGWIGRGVGFVLSRWWTGSKKQDHAAYLNSVADLAAKMRANGMTIDEVRQFEETMQNPSVAASQGASGVVEQFAADEDHEPMAFQSNVAMKARAGTAYGVADAQLDQALMDLRLLIGEHEWEHIKKAQAHWREYRSALEDAALREYEGGTHATLAMTMVGLAETERRAAEIRAQVIERSAR